MLQNLRKVVAVVGCQRSGTTLTGQILGAHPNAVMLDEPEGMYEWFDAATSGTKGHKKFLRRSLRMANRKYRPKHRRLKKKPEGGFEMRPGVSHLILKAPNLTYAFDQLSNLDLPAVAVFLVRDPRAVVASLGGLQRIPMVENQVSLIRKHPDIAVEFAAEVEEMSSPDTSDTVKRTHFWRIKSDLFRKFQERQIPTLLVKYEDLVADTEGMCAKIAEHIGLPFSAEMLAHEEVFQGFGPGKTKRTRAVDTSSLDSWKKRLSPDQETTILELSTKEMDFFGYDATASVQESTQGPTVGEAVLRAPIILAGRGGSGTRVLAQDAADGNLFLGNTLNESADSVEWVEPLYEIAISTLGRDYYLRNVPDNLGEDWGRYLTSTAREILAKGNWDGKQPWGWKLPETMLVLPELFKTFPDAKFVHLVRHPVTSSLRRSHVTSRTKNPVGNAVLKSTYLASGLDPSLHKDHDTYMHNALTWRFQVGNVVRYAKENLSDTQYLMLKYEDFRSHPAKTKKSLMDFMGTPDSNPGFVDIDPARTGDIKPEDPRVNEVWELCKEVATEIGYEPVRR